MAAAVPLRYVVGEAEHRLVVAVGRLDRYFDGDTLAVAEDRDRRAVEALLGAVEIFDEGLETAFVVHGDGFGLDAAGIGERQRDARVEEGELAQPMLQCREIELG